MKVGFQRVLDSSSKKGVAKIFGGTVLAQGIIGVSAPVLSRIYSPSDFGLLATFTAVVGILAIASSGRLEMAVPIAKSEAKAKMIVRAALALSFLSGAGGCLLILPFSAVAAKLTGVPSLEHWLWLAPPTAGLAASFIVLNQWAVRVREFGLIGRRNALRAVLTTLTQIGGGVAGLRPGGLVVGLLMGHWFGSASMMKANFTLLDIFRGFRELRPVLAQFRSFSAKLTISGLFNVGGSQLPILMFATAYSSTEVGWLALTQRVLALPVALIGTAIAQVYVSNLAAATRQGSEVRSVFLRVTLSLTVVGAVGATVLGFFGPFLFRVIFGGEWEQAGQYARYIGLAIAAQLVSVPLSQTMIIVGRTTMQLVWDVGRFVVVCGATLLAIAAERSATTTVVVLSASMFLTYLAQWVANLRAVTDMAGKQ